MYHVPWIALFSAKRWQLDVLTLLIKGFGHNTIYIFSLIFQPIDALLKTSIGDFLSALTDPDLNVRRVALVAFNSAAHNKPSLIRDLLRK